jgi:hypothetical protein
MVGQGNNLSLVGEFLRLGFSFEIFEKLLLFVQKAYAYFKGRFVLIETGIHPNGLGRDGKLITVLFLLFGKEDKGVIITMQSVEEEMFTVDSYFRHNQAGAFRRKIDDGGRYHSWERFLGAHVK